MGKVINIDRQEGSIKETTRRFDGRDWKYLVDYVVDTAMKRKKSREDREKQWDEIDRQIAMEPNIEYKKLADGTPDVRKAWLSEMEMPLQAQALEVLVSDSRRMMFPDSGPWFRAHAEMTDAYLEKINFKSIIHGDESQVPSEVNQDNVDKLVEGFMSFMFRQYDHVSRFDRINAESFKYGMGVGRARKQKKNIYIHEARGVRIDKRNIPVILPASIRNVYLDDPKPTVHSAQELGDAHIWHDYLKYENLAIAANKGSTDPDDEDGGWMPKELSKVKPDDKGYVQIFEMEGDIIVPRKTVRSVVIPNAIITVAMGGADKAEKTATRAVVRFRFRKKPYSSYLLFPYHYEGADDTYPTSPLMKGRPIQMMATDALNRISDSSMLKIAPPVSYDPNSASFSQSGGPRIEPFAMWDTIDPIQVHTDIGGDPSTMSALLAQAINMYAELTGVLPARLGAQTRSHTTAYSKDAEIQRGASRTVDYVNQTGQGPITRWLDMAYDLGRDCLGSNEDVSFWIDAYGGYVSIDKSMLPDKCMFEWFGSGGPQDKQQKDANMINAAMGAVKLDQMNMQMGRQPHINLNSIIDEVLRRGGWSDLAAITTGNGAIAGASAASAIPGASQGGAPAVAAALQSLQSAGG